MNHKEVCVSGLRMLGKSMAKIVERRRKKGAAKLTFAKSGKSLTENIEFE